MPDMTPTDRIHSRVVLNQVKLIHEHLEAMQRDAHGLEYEPWRREVDAIWKMRFKNIGLMSAGPQQSSLEMIRETWTTYLTHYRLGSE